MEGNNGGKIGFDPTRGNETMVSERRGESSIVCGVSGEMPPPPDTWSMKQQRKQSTVAMGVAGGLTGLLVGGPIVGFVTGFAGAVITKKKMKKREKKALEKYQTDGQTK